MNGTKHMLFICASVSENSMSAVLTDTNHKTVENEEISELVLIILNSSKSFICSAQFDGFKVAEFEVSEVRNVQVMKEI
jgi:hypothetical protein